MIWSFSPLIIALAAIAAGAHAGNEHPERWYQVRWCEAHHGQTEYVLPDRTRCDYLTDTHAVEVDFGRKWVEAIGTTGGTQKRPPASCRRPGWLVAMDIRLYPTTLQKDR
jgi:hypothetical protein